MTVNPTLLLDACSETRGIGVVLGVSVKGGSWEEKLKVGRLKLLIGRETAGRFGTSATWSRETSQLNTVPEINYLLSRKSNADANLIVRSFGGRSDTPLSLHLAPTGTRDTCSRCAGQRVQQTTCAEDIQRRRGGKKKNIHDTLYCNYMSVINLCNLIGFLLTP